MKQMLCMLAVLLILPSMATADFDAVISVDPPVAGSCIAVQIAASAPLSGLRWYHNDGTQVFPRVVIVEGEAGQAPDLTNPGLILDEVTGVSAGWGELSLVSPVTSSTGTAFAVFFFPGGEQTTSLGTNGGPGLGIRQTPVETAPFYITADALHWARVSPEFELGVEPVYGAQRGAEPRTIAEVGVQVDLPEPAVEQEQPTVQGATGMHAPHPNPFNPNVELSYSLALPSTVQLAVYDLRGRLVRTVVSGPQTAGDHAAMWDGIDDQGRRVASGVYFARFEGAGLVQTHRMVLLK